LCEHKPQLGEAWQRQISELPAENSALALRVSLVRTAARISGPAGLLERSPRSDFSEDEHDEQAKPPND